VSDAAASTPDWDRLYLTASEQEGLFTTRQAAAAGYSPQLLVHHLQGGRARRVRRGIYRLVHFPPGEHEELVMAWLWSARAGVLSHQTALALHELSDVLPAQVHLTLPASWRRRRFRIPPGVVLHHADVAGDERTWSGAVPVTSVRRTLEDCAAADLAPELLRQAARQALQRGLVAPGDLGSVAAALAPFGGLAA
jgi:predicted transcriptional regulator of viral defense system